MVDTSIEGDTNTSIEGDGGDKGASNVDFVGTASVSFTEDNRELTNDIEGAIVKTFGNKLICIAACVKVLAVEGVIDFAIDKDDECGGTIICDGMLYIGRTEAMFRNDCNCGVPAIIPWSYFIYSKPVYSLG